ncbi:glycoside hydrolase family 43 protein [Echinicola jeungdonensis]|uniref:Glycoside hydrolase family 43 protein n=1 Tax=Echinicola jeungdonensis TaxID=709343 RepID=A0ABV5J9J9_9BACT|nr:glycoside hydrolase family 43 protein [Echinicola jeungdonensis]MDN3670401.1 glycoside hydrolase family 43 protein [Echinicola jeungdonensis]
MMIRFKIFATIFIWNVLAFTGLAQESIKQKPIIQSKFTADPAPMVYNDTVFLYTSHDEDDAEGFKMLDWLLYTTTDMVNWTEHGAVASLKDFSWARQDNGAWAVQCIERNGKFYLYCPMHGGGIGVLVSDNPYGPFKDPLGKRLIETDHIWNDIDPSPFIDDDGQAYLYWGNPDIYYVKLNEDMISYSGGVIKEPSKPDNYQEGPWVWKRNGHYYMAYASTCCPEGIGYAMSDSPSGPWEYKGMIMDASEKTRGNHPGIIDYKGESYVFGHSYDLLKHETSTFYERRSVDLDEMQYNADGTIRNRHYWSIEGPDQVVSFNPFHWVEAETMAWSKGVKSKKDTLTGVFVSQIHNGDFIQVSGVDFAEGAMKFEANVAPLLGGQVDIRLDDKDGTLIGVCEIENTGGENVWNTFETKVEKITGVHDLFFVFRGREGELFKFDSWRFIK